MSNLFRDAENQGPRWGKISRSERKEKVILWKIWSKVIIIREARQDTYGEPLGERNPRAFGKVILFV